MCPALMKNACCLMVQMNKNVYLQLISLSICYSLPKFLQLYAFPPTAPNPSASRQKKPGEALLGIRAFGSQRPWRLPIRGEHGGAAPVVPSAQRFPFAQRPPALLLPVSVQLLQLSPGTLAGHRARRPIPISQSSAPATSSSRLLLLLLLLPLPPARHEGMEAAAVATRGQPGTVVLPLQQADGPNGPLADGAGGSGVGGSPGLDAGVAEHVSAGLHGSGALEGIHADAADPDGSRRCWLLPGLLHCCSRTGLLAAAGRTRRLGFHWWHSGVPRPLVGLTSSSVTGSTRRFLGHLAGPGGSSLDGSTQRLLRHWQHSEAPQTLAALGSSSAASVSQAECWGTTQRWWP